MFMIQLLVHIFKKISVKTQNYWIIVTDPKENLRFHMLVVYNYVFIWLLRRRSSGCKIHGAYWITKLLVCNLTWMVNLQVICCQGWDILLVWGSTRQLGKLEAAIWPCQVCKWSDFGHWGLQGASWSGTLPTQPCCWPSPRKVCFHSIWQVHLHLVCCFCKSSIHREMLVKLIVMIIGL